MKWIIFILLSTSFAFAQNPSSKSALASKFNAYVKQKSETVEGNVEQDYRNLVSIKLTDDDINLVQDALLTLVKLDKEDPSRTSVQILATAYSKNPKLFKKAFKIIKTSENEKTVKEIEAMMKSFSSVGNG